MLTFGLFIWHSFQKFYRSDGIVASMSFSRLTSLRSQLESTTSPPLANQVSAPRAESVNDARDEILQGEVNTALDQSPDRVSDPSQPRNLAELEVTSPIDSAPGSGHGNGTGQIQSTTVSSFLRSIWQRFGCGGTRSTPDDDVSCNDTPSQSGNAFAIGSGVGHTTGTQTVYIGNGGAL